MKKRMLSLCVVLSVILSVFSTVSVGATDESILQEYYGETFSGTGFMLYALQDISDDGVPELFLSDSEFGMGSPCLVYTNIEGAEVNLGEIYMGDGLYVSDDEKVYSCSGGTGVIMYSELCIFDRSIGILENPYLAANVQWGVEEYFCNAEIVSMAEFLALEEELKPLSFSNVFDLPERNDFDDENFSEPEKKLDLLECFKNQIGKSYAYYLPDDYDNDGREEAYVITGEVEDAEYGIYDNAQIYFVNSNGECILVQSGLYGGLENTVHTENGAFVVWCDMAYTTSCFSYIYGVKDGKVHKPAISGQYDFFYQRNGSYFAEKVVFTQYRDIVEYELFYDPDNREFLLEKPEKKEPEEEKDITDFNSVVSPWAKEEVEEAYQKGLVPETLVGKDLTQKINRAEFAAIAVTVYEQLSEKELSAYTTPFMDIDTDPNKKEIEKAYAAGITVGTGERIFEPKTFITREQLATMLCRSIKKYKFPEWTIDTDDKYYMQDISGKRFADDEEISDYARNSVYFMSGIGIIKGVDETHFAPKANVTMQEAINYGMATREQAIVMANRIKKLQGIVDDM